MRLSPTLLRYLATRYLQFFLVVLLILATVIFLFEFAELLRRGLSKDVPFDLLFRMGLYKMPETLERALPFMVLFSGLITFWQLTRTQELVVVRATGLSAWQFLLPIILVVMLFSLLNLMVVNPVGAMFIGRFKEMENTYLRRLSGFELTSSGLWLRQQDQNRGRHYLMQSEKVTLNPLTLQPVMVLVYDDDRNYLGRIDAEEATLKKGAWHMAGATLHWSRQTPMSQSYTIPTDLTETRIQDSLAAPNTVSFWDLPHFIQALQSIGLPTQRHIIQWQILMAKPVLLLAMCLVAAVFALRMTRMGKSVLYIGIGAAAGSMIFGADAMLTALGMNGALPPLLAVWMIPSLSLLGALAALLYAEDG